MSTAVFDPFGDASGEVVHLARAPLCHPVLHVGAPFEGTQGSAPNQPKSQWHGGRGDDVSTKQHRSRAGTPPADKTLQEPAGDGPPPNVTQGGTIPWHCS